MQPFGSLAAEDELSILKNLYLVNLSDKRHELALFPHHRIILGRRGSGKTALAEYLRFQKVKPYDAYVTIDYTPTLGIILREVDEHLSRQRIPFADDVVRLWLLAFWTSLMTELVRAGHLNSSAVRTYLATASPITMVGRRHGALDGLAAAIRTEQRSLLDWDHLRRRLDESAYPAAVDDTKQCLTQLHRVAIAVDSIDALPIQSAAMIAVATALLTAANRSASELHEHLHLKCFVPSEVWAYLAARMPDVGKFQPLEIRWSPDDLLRLACFRYNNFLAEEDFHGAVAPSSVTWASATDVREKVWKRFFPSNAQGPSGLLEDVETLILRHTQLRPRQLILVCNAIAGKSALRKFNPDHVRDGLESVDVLATEVFASYSSICPGAEVMLGRHLRNRPAVFDSKEIAATDECWDVAYELGVAGPVTHAARPFKDSRLEYHNAEFDFSGTRLSRWRPNRERVAIHPMFHKRFGIKEDAHTMVGLRSRRDDHGLIEPSLDSAASTKSFGE